MERLTMTSDKGGVAFTFDLEVEATPQEIIKILRLAEKLKYYEDLEEQGRLLVLPCKIGDSLYWIDDEDDDGNEGLCIKQYNENEKVQAIGIDKDGDIFVMIGIDEFTTVPATIGSRYALLTLEDAKKMLAEMKKNESEE
jgi:hypothetical protein|nr:MAG TPA: hypothetical protein [Bacteriophage sp.]